MATVDNESTNNSSQEVCVLEEFKHLSEVEKLIENVPNSHKDTNSREIVEERFKCKYFYIDIFLIDVKIAKLNFN